MMSSHVTQSSHSLQLYVQKLCCLGWPMQPRATWCTRGAHQLALAQSVVWCFGRYLDALIEAEAAAGIPSTRVVVAGFSQVGSPALLHTRLLATLFDSVRGRPVALS